MRSARRSCSDSTVAEGSPLRIGLISDTHGLLRPEALRALCGMDLIIHAGDIGSPHVLEELRKLAPVHAVRGNNDDGAWARRIPEQFDLMLEATAVHVLHDIKELRSQLLPAPPSVIIAGHSHRASITEKEGRMYVNPGSAGPRRFKLPVTLAILELTEGSRRARIVPLL